MSQQLGPLAGSNYTIKAYFLSLLFYKKKIDWLSSLSGPQRHPRFVLEGVVAGGDGGM